MTLHMERHSVPSDYSVEQNGRKSSVDALAFIGSRARVSPEQLASLREHGRQSRASSRADRFERMALERSSSTQLRTASKRRTQNCTESARRIERQNLSHTEFWTSTRPASEVARSTVRDNDRRAAITQRSVENMQTVTAAALGVIAGFILFLIVLYAG